MGGYWVWCVCIIYIYIYTYICVYGHHPPCDTQTPSKHCKNQCETCIFVGRISAHFRMKHSYRIAIQEKRKIPESKIPKFQKSKNLKSKNPKIQHFSHVRNLAKKVWISWIIGFLDSLIFGILKFLIFVVFLWFCALFD